MSIEEPTTRSGTAGWQFWIDRGGTFTDVVARTPGGDVLTGKLLSENPRHYPMRRSRESAGYWSGPVWRPRSTP